MRFITRMENKIQAKKRTYSKASLANSEYLLTVTINGSPFGIIYMLIVTMLTHPAIMFHSLHEPSGQVKSIRECQSIVWREWARLIYFFNYSLFQTSAKIMPQQSQEQNIITQKGQQRSWSLSHKRHFKCDLTTI